MKIIRVKLNSDDLQKVVTHFKKENSFDYTNETCDFAVLASEKFYFRNSSTQLNAIIIKLEGEELVVDIIGAAGGTGLFNISWGSERGFTNKIKSMLSEYSKRHLIKMEEIHIR